MGRAKLAPEDRQPANDFVLQSYRCMRCKETKNFRELISRQSSMRRIPLLEGAFFRMDIHRNCGNCVAAIYEEERRAARREMEEAHS